MRYDLRAALGNLAYIGGVAISTVGEMSRMSANTVRVLSGVFSVAPPVIAQKN